MGVNVTKGIFMTALDKYIEDLVNNIEPEEFGAFPKNESSWEELFEFGQRRISEIVALRKENVRLQERILQLEASQQIVQQMGLESPLEKADEYH